jgi:hypothetical protein
MRSSITAFLVAIRSSLRTRAELEAEILSLRHQVGGHGPKSVGAICDPAVFNGIVEVPVGVLGPRHGSVVVDLVEPGGEPLMWPGTIVMKQEFRDCVPGW